ncbi:hypothetical protein JOC33_001517 [Thalassobacillus pellis]|nr:hypothetical protein [Thalassobacillus pellis]
MSELPSASLFTEVDLIQYLRRKDDKKQTDIDSLLFLL